MMSPINIAMISDRTFFIINYFGFYVPTLL
jgi:hypothetical protein